MRIKWVFEYVKVREKNRGVKRRGMGLKVIECYVFVE